MIEKIRKPTKSKNFMNYIVYALIFGMIIASFVLMIPGLGGGGVQSASDAATVGSVSITRRDYLDQVKQLESQYAQMFNGEFPENMRPMVRRSALQGLVRTEVLSNYAKEKGLLVANDEVGYMLKEAPAFQEDGEFSRDRYDNYLSYLGKSAAQFESKLKKQIATQRLNEYFAQGLISVPQETELNESADNISLEFEFIELSPSSLKSQIKISDEDAKAAIEDEETLKAVELFYPRVKSEYKTKEKVQVSQILLDDKSEEKAKELRATLTKENFSKLAQENSIDPLTKDKGGDLGMIKRGDFDLAIEREAFKLKEGEISDPIKTKSGYSIILVGKKEEAKNADFETVKVEIAKKYLESEAAKNLSKELVDMAEKKNLTGLTARAEKMGLKWNNPGKFSLSDQALPGIGDSKEIESALLKLDDGAIHPKTIAYQGKEYLVKRLKLNTVKDDTKAPKLNSSGRGDNLLQTVFEKHKEDLEVSINPSLFDS